MWIAWVVLSNLLSIIFGFGLGGALVLHKVDYIIAQALHIDTEQQALVDREFEP